MPTEREIGIQSQGRCALEVGSVASGLDDNLQKELGAGSLEYLGPQPRRQASHTSIQIEHFLQTSHM